MPVPPDPTPIRGGVTQLGESTSGNLVTFDQNGVIKDSGFTIGDAISSGGALVADSLSVTSGATVGGAMVGSSTFNLTGAATVGGALHVTGAETVTGAFVGSSTMNVTGAATVGGALHVTSGGTISGASVVMPNLPTSDPSVAGALWTSGGAVLYSAG